MEKAAVGGRFLIVGVPERLDRAAKRAVRELQPGGFILFGRNIGLPPIPDAEGRVGTPGNPRRLAELIAELRSLVNHEALFCVDQEGGRVSRLRGLRNASEAPFARQLAERKDRPLIRLHGRLTGQLLRLFGIQLDLCPVLDVAYDPDADNSLRHRCWGRTPQEVAANAAAFNRGLRSESVLSCGKHFPGYSRASVDPHHELPRIDAGLSELQRDWLPYRRLASQLDFVMTGHGLYPAIDESGVPGSLSHAAIRLLRSRLGFKGWVMSDDFDMGAITRHVGLDESVQRAVQAGTDQILLCHDIGRARQAAEAITRLPRRSLQPGLKRLDRLQTRLRALARRRRPFSPTTFEAINREIQELRDRTLGLGAPRFSGGSGKIGAVEAANLSPVNTVGDRAAGVPAEYLRRT